jgi:hypothetical protein
VATRKKKEGKRMITCKTSKQKHSYEQTNVTKKKGDKGSERNTRQVSQCRRKRFPMNKKRYIEKEKNT